MPGLRQDTVAKLDLDSNMSNKERFEKLKESRQKYKDEAKAAKDRCEALEQQLKMLVAQMESEDASAAAGAGAGASAAAENESLKAQLAEAREECARLEKVVLERSQAMQRATMEANEWRKKAERAAKASASASATGAAATTTTTDAAAYAYGALLGAGVVAGIGYVALTYGMKR